MAKAPYWSGHSVLCLPKTLYVLRREVRGNIADWSAAAAGVCDNDWRERNGSTNHPPSTFRLYSGTGGALGRGGDKGALLPSEAKIPGDVG